jgi:DNA invertase Pin-like site-specific DNA recombinase
VQGHRSGRHEHTRPEWRKAKARYLAAKKSVLVVYELDRSNRNVNAMSQLIEQIRSQPQRYRLVLVMDRFDSARDGWGANEIRNLHIDAAAAQYESDKAAERMTNTIRTLQSHHVPWGTTPYGLLRAGRGMKAKWVRGKYADQVTTLLRMYARGMGYLTVAEEMNRRGLPYWKSSRDPARTRVELPQRWNADRVRQIVGNVMVYAGYMIPMRGRSFQRRVKLAGEGTVLERCARAYDAVPPPAIEALIGEDIAEAVLSRRMSLEQRGRRKPERGWTALIGGIAYCGSRALRAHNDRDIRTYRTRSGKPALAFNADAIEQELIAKLENLEFPPHVKIKVREILLEQTSDAERARADAAGRKARAALLDLERKSALGDIDEATYRTLKDEFHEQIDAAERNPAGAGSDRANDGRSDEPGIGGEKCAAELALAGHAFAVRASRGDDGGQGWENGSERLGKRGFCAAQSRVEAAFRYQ